MFRAWADNLISGVSGLTACLAMDRALKAVPHIGIMCNWGEFLSLYFLKIFYIFSIFKSKRKQFKIRNMEVWAAGDLPVKDEDEEGAGDGQVCVLSLLMFIKYA